jgi:hypothetical protein
MGVNFHSSQRSFAMNKLFTVLLPIFLFSCSSAPKSNYYSFNKALEIGIQKIEGDLPKGAHISVLSTCLVFLDFENFSEQVNVPASGTIPVDNINPGFYSIYLLYNDYASQYIKFEIFPGKTTILNLAYRSGPAPHFPPVSTIQSRTITTQDGKPEWYSFRDKPEGDIWGMGTGNDRYIAEKVAYSEIASQLNPIVLETLYERPDGSQVDETLLITRNIARVASLSKILYVSYDPRKRIFWALAGLNRSDAENIR